MNKEWLLSHFREAHEELTQIIRRVESDPNFGDIELEIALTHMYHHVNTAWNSRDVDPARAWACAQEDFDAWRVFPADISLGRESAK